MSRVPATKPYFSPDDIDYILNNFSKILKGDSFLSMHKYGEQFEKEFADYIGVEYAVACNSGTSALELIFSAIDVRDKEVILPSNTFLATAIAIRNAGGSLVFADCGDDMCLDFDSVIDKVSSSTKAICIVHIGGIVSDSTIRLKEYCEHNNLHLIEDAAQAHGSSLGGVSAGAFGTGSGFSFFSTKVMTTGEGGMVTTDDLELVKKMRSLREFGKVKTDIYINYHKYFGYNWRMPEVAALMGIRQLASLDSFMERRREIAKIYDRELENIKSIKIIEPHEKATHNYFKYVVTLPNHDRVKIHKELEKRGIQLSGYIYELPLHKQPVFPEHNQITLPKSEYLCSRHLCLPIFYGMEDKQAKYVSDTLKDVLV